MLCCPELHHIVFQWPTVRSLPHTRHPQRPLPTLHFTKHSQICYRRNNPLTVVRLQGQARKYVERQKTTLAIADLLQRDDAAVSRMAPCYAWCADLVLPRGMPACVRCCCPFTTIKILLPWRMHLTHRRGKVSTGRFTQPLTIVAILTPNDRHAHADSLPPLPSDVEGGLDGTSPSQSQRNISRNPASTPMSQGRSFGGLINSSVRMNANAGPVANRRGSMSYSQSVCSSATFVPLVGCLQHLHAHHLVKYFWSHCTLKAVELSRTI